VGPRCVDGTLLREMRLSRQECTPEERNVELVAPGCEAELLTAPGAFGTSQVFSPWMNLKSNLTKEHKNHLAASPEESEYFYDEYVDYPYNETLNNLSTDSSKQDSQNSTPKSPHYTPGDTPTIYAAPKNKTRPDIPKEIVNSPSTSGFTFFGVPLPSLNLKNLLGGTGRMDDKKMPINTPIAERKTAIVNKPPRSGARGGLGLPNTPEIQTGGFVPLLPGSGGFKPIPNPHLQLPQPSNVSFDKATPSLIQTSQSTEPYLLKNDGAASMGHPVPTPPATAPPITSVPLVQNKTEDVLEVAKIEEITTKAKIASSMIEIQTAPPDEEKFEDLFDKVVESVPGTTTADLEVAEVPDITTEKMTTFGTEIVTSTPVPSSSAGPKEDAKKAMATPLSALLVPGGQQPEFRPAGRPTITKVQSPHVSGSAPLLSNLELGEVGEPSPHNRESQTRDATSDAPRSDDTSWYFANYNKTNLEPFVGISESASSGCSLASWQTVLNLILVSIFLFKTN
jgi:hypothetical protein